MNIQTVVEKLKAIKQRGYISVNQRLYRADDGAAGRLLEDHLGIKENNLAQSDLGDYELKTIRKKSTALTLCHKKPFAGLTPLQIFSRFGYINYSDRDPDLLHKKLFTTIRGTRKNSLAFIIKPIHYELTRQQITQLNWTDDSDFQNRFALFYEDELISAWDLNDSLKKMNKLILVEVLTQGKTHSQKEKYHFHKVWICENIKPISTLINCGALTLDFCIDQILDSAAPIHDRGPHIRLQRSQLLQSYQNVVELII